MNYSIIITDVFTDKGPKTFTLRWSKKESINWKYIFEFISNKGGMIPDCYTIKIGKNYIKYNELNDISPFDFKKCVYYDQLGKPTGTGLLKTGVNLSVGKIIKN